MHAIDLGCGCTQKVDISMPLFQLHVLDSSLTLHVRDSQLYSRHSMSFFR